MLEYDIADLKVKYRVGSVPDDDIDCSVGGALCLEMLIKADGLTSTQRDDILPVVSFPPATWLQEFLSIANTVCGESALIEYSKRIFDLNADGDIEEAWKVLEEALNDVG